MLLIFAGLNFRDFRDFQKIAKFKTHKNLFQMFSIVFFMLIAYVLATEKIAKIKSREICTFDFREIKLRENK